MIAGLVSHRSYCASDFAAVAKRLVGSGGTEYDLQRNAHPLTLAEIAAFTPSAMAVSQRGGR